MNEITKQKILDEIIKLPKIKQVAINSVDWIKKTDEISNQFGLIDEENERIQIEIGLILSGLTDIEDFDYILQNEVGLSEEITKKIIAEIYKNVFDPILSIISNDIKNNIEFTKTPWDQTINFIISGGDYSYFIK
ncbi:MAG: hypothetical protein NTU81_01965 [Candidatus Nomurabacteria bacterium]|nr:hypothetical protein [Candidatus Nomurabacteria bacterium]